MLALTRSLALVTLVAGWATQALTRDIVGQLIFNDVLPSINELSVNAKVWIGDRSNETSFIWANGSFVIYDVNPGFYVLRVSPHQFIFNDLSLEVPADASLPVSVHLYDWRYAVPPLDLRGPSLPYPIKIVPLGRPEYDPKVESFNPLKMLMANPMYLLMGGMAVLMLIMPKLVGMMDPEAVAEMQANQAQMHKSMASLQSGDFSGFKKMLSDTADNPPSSTPLTETKSIKPAQGNSSGVRAHGGSAKKRR